MSFDELKPFLKVGVAGIGIAVVGLIAKCSFGSSRMPTDACNALKMDNINPCIARMHACTGYEDAVTACQKKVLSDLQ